MHFGNFLKKILEDFRNLLQISEIFSASGGGGAPPPDPPRNRPLKMFHLRNKILATPLLRDTSVKFSGYLDILRMSSFSPSARSGLSKIYPC